jgi:hypothetical protein
MTTADVIEMVRREALHGQVAFAIKAGVTQQYISDLLRGKREPGPKILDALGLRKVITYEVKE